MLAPTPPGIGPRLPDLFQAFEGIRTTVSLPTGGLPHSGIISLAVAGGVISPVLILVLCVAAGVGTVLLLPGRKEAPVRKIGGVIVLAAGLILGAVLVRSVARGQGVGVYFWIFAFIALAAAVRVVTHPRPVYAALYFVLTTFATAGLFILLWAEFMAAALILIYAGAILITYVFVIMLASQAAAPDEGANGEGIPGAGDTPPRGLAAVTEYDAVSREPVVAAAVGFTLMGVLLFVVFDRAEGVAPPVLSDPRVEKQVAQVGVDQPSKGSTQQLGEYLFNNQLVNLELAGLILTVSMVGAIVIARRRVLGTHPVGPVTEDVMSTPATPISDDPYSIPVYGTDNPRQKAYPET